MKMLPTGRENFFMFFVSLNLNFQNLTCNYNGRCLINSKTRKDCTKCRLIKCFEIGMRSDVIGSATSERQRKNSLSRFGNSINAQNMIQHPNLFGSSNHRHDENDPKEENVEILPTRGRINTGSDSGSNSSDELSRKVLNSIRSDRMEQHRHLVQSLDLFGTNSSSQNLDTTPSHRLIFTPRDRRSPEPMIEAKKKCSDIDSSSMKYRESFQPRPLHHIPIGYCYTRNLNPDEAVHIEAVKEAAAAIRARVFVTDDAKCTRPVLAAMKLQSFGVDKLIAGMTRISSFSLLDDNLKATLLKGAIAEMMLVRSTMHFDSRSKGWTINAVDAPQTSLLCDKNPLSLMPSSSRQLSTISQLEPMSSNTSFHLSLELFQHIPGATEWVDDYLKFCDLMDQSWKDDEVLITLLMVLILFNPENVELHQIKEIK